MEYLGKKGKGEKKGGKRKGNIQLRAKKKTNY